MTDRLEHRIQRAEFGMSNAKDKNWRWAWYRAFVIAVNEKNAQVAARAVRSPPSLRAWQGGVRRVTESSVEAASRMESTTDVVGMEGVA